MRDIINEFGQWLGTINKAHTGICTGCPVRPMCKMYDSCDIAIKAFLRNNARNTVAQKVESGQVLKRSA